MYLTEVGREILVLYASLAVANVDNPAHFVVHSMQQPSRKFFPSLENPHSDGSIDLGQSFKTRVPEIFS
jgi:hypothetical protein